MVYNYHNETDQILCQRVYYMMATRLELLLFLLQNLYQDTPLWQGKLRNTPHGQLILEMLDRRDRITGQVFIGHVDSEWKLEYPKPILHIVVER